AFSIAVAAPSEPTAFSYSLDPARGDRVALGGERPWGRPFTPATQSHRIARWIEGVFIGEPFRRSVLAFSVNLPPTASRPRPRPCAPPLGGRGLAARRPADRSRVHRRRPGGRRGTHPLADRRAVPWGRGRHAARGRGRDLRRRERRLAGNERLARRPRPPL